MRKAQRVTLALERRRGRLLQGGVHNLLLVATDMTLLRQKLAAHQGAQVTTVAARGGLDIYEGKG